MELNEMGETILDGLLDRMKTDKNAKLADVVVKLIRRRQERNMKTRPGYIKPPKINPENIHKTESVYPLVDMGNIHRE